MERRGVLGSVCARGWGMHLILTLALVCSGAAVTVETASAPGAVPSRYPSPPWGPQVSGASSLEIRAVGGLGWFPLPLRRCCLRIGVRGP